MSELSALLEQRIREYGLACRESWMRPSEIGIAESALRSQIEEEIRAAVEQVTRERDEVTSACVKWQDKALAAEARLRELEGSPTGKDAPR